mmetsp:Transcript_14005/g.42382  ORF Transcript_14005/g.42382 Transcript_14005/m.42382 type:complete len:394 (-) Transcript_14005:133-1314(-)
MPRDLVRDLVVATAAATALCVAAFLLLHSTSPRPPPATLIVERRTTTNLPATRCSLTERTRGLEEVGHVCNCTAMAWCDLVCACPAAGGTQRAYSACDLRRCDHIALSPPGEGPPQPHGTRAPPPLAVTLTCRSAAPGVSGAPTCAPPGTLPALPEPVATRRSPPPSASPARSPSSPEGSSENTPPFAVTQVFSDAATLFWAQPPLAEWCVRARRPDGTLVPAGSGPNGCLPSAAPASASAQAVTSALASPSCSVGPLDAGLHYSLELRRGCGDDAPTLFAGGGVTPGPEGAQCASRDDQAVLMAPGFMGGVHQCGHSCWGKGACSTTCVQALGMSEGCAACWGGVVGCGAWNCWNTCMFGQESDECKKCGREHCQGEFQACIGAEGVPMPDA